MTRRHQLVSMLGCLLLPISFELHPAVCGQALGGVEALPAAASRAAGLPARLTGIYLYRFICAADCATVVWLGCEGAYPTKLQYYLGIG